MLNQSNVNYINKALDVISVFPVIIRCVACDSGNVITNPCCCQCGMPLGQVVEDKINNYIKSKQKYSPFQMSPSATTHQYFTSSSSMAYMPYNIPKTRTYPKNYIKASASVSPSSSSDDEYDEYPEIFEDELVEDTTPMYAKCANCYTLNDVRKNDFCVCGIPTSVEEINHD